MKGLTDLEVYEQRKKNGSNEITKNKKNSFIKLLLESLGDPIIKILLIALAIKIIFLFKDFDWYETIGILIAIFLATFISTISEYGSEAAFQRLQEDSKSEKSRVLRNNRISEINSGEIVTKDIVVLGAGDKVPADGYLIKGNLTVDESLINGETKEVQKLSVSNNEIKENNLLYRGTIVYSNEGYMLVTEVGNNTLYGKIASEIQEKEPISPLKLRLRELAKIISKLGYIGAGLVTLSYLFSAIVISNNYNWPIILNTLTDFHQMADYLIYALTLSVTIIVVAVPEGLPMMITLVLSGNMKRMLKDNVLVRKLVGIETAGSLNVLLTDKTGTLTKGKLEVIDLISGEFKSFKKNIQLKEYMPFYEKVYQNCFYNNASSFDGEKVVGGNSTDKAILKYIGSDININNKVIDNVLFDSKIKYSACTLENNITHFKGAPEIILGKCTTVLKSNGEEKEFINKNFISRKINSLTKSGNRVLALAYNKSSNELAKLTFIGIIVIKDEIRDEAKEGLELISKAGIQTIMITGDAKDTALSIARDLNIVNSSKDLVLTSEELNKYDDDDLTKIIPNIKVIARALPSDKSRLAKVIEDMDLTVGMTGDGVNDAPALKKANVGFAMGSGTEVAKEAADIVILDDNILSISKAILYGRTTFKSIRKFVIYQLTVNMCALLLSIIGPFIGINTPITIVQMLWLNMIMDTFAGIAFSYEPPLKDYMYEEPKRKFEPIINSYMYGEILFTGIYSFLLCLAFLKAPIFKNLIRFDSNGNYLLTAYFALFIFIGIFNAFNARSERLNIFANLSKNLVFVFIILFIIVVQVLLIYFGGDLFRAYGLTAKEFFLVLCLSITVIPIDFIRKIFLRVNNLKRGV